MTRRAIWRWMLAGVAGMVLLGQSMPAQAGVVREYDLHFTGFVVLPCTGEVVTLEGFETITTKTEVDSSGATHITMLSRTSGTGTDADGTVYHFRGQDRIVSYTSLDGAPRNECRSETLQAVSPGPESNFLLHSTSQTTVNANGEVTAQSFNFQSECKG
jgi:hypothetical protein